MGDIHKSARDHDPSAGGSRADRPIIFSAPMVRALLSGAKTQTRRIAKAFADKPDLDAILRRFPNQAGCPYGAPGDRLWVREACRGEELDTGYDGVRYRADDAWVAIDNTRDAAEGWLGLHTYRGHSGAPAGPWVPSIHMPRWASRITLEVTDVRVERLQDMTEADAKAEGSQETSLVPIIHACWSERDAFAKLWNHINGPDAWAANPWVWAVTFKRIEPTDISARDEPVASASSREAS